MAREIFVVKANARERLRKSIGTARFLCTRHEPYLSGGSNAERMPQIRFAVAAPLAISRGFAVSGLFSWMINPGRHSRTRLPGATYISPLWGFSLRLRRKIGIFGRWIECATRDC